MAYRIEFARGVQKHLDCLTKTQRVRTFEGIRTHLQHQPLVEARNRKRLCPNPLAPWELRMGEMRVFDEVVEEQPDVARILAVGYKDRNRLVVGGLDIRL